MSEWLGVRKGPWFVLFIVFSPEVALAQEVDPENLRPGLVAVFRDSAKPVPCEITRLEPTLALAWKAGETAHPRLTPDGNTVRWEGFLNLPRPGSYQFRIRLVGKFKLTIAGKEMFSGEAKQNSPTLLDGPTIALEAGVHPLTAEFTRFPGAARLEVSWQAGHFRLEPLPYDHLGHLPARAPSSLKASQEADLGRFLAEEHSCTCCHVTASDNVLTRGMVVREGPDLTRVGERTYAGWIYRWLESPRKLRSATVMPELFSPDEAGRVERFAVATYLASLGGPVPSEDRPSRGGNRRGQSSVAQGETLFRSIGCVVCHPVGKQGDEPAPSLRSGFYGFASLVSSRAEYPLDALSAKTSIGPLTTYLMDPLKVNPGGRMPRLPLRQEEARDLALYLCRDAGADAQHELPPAPDRASRASAFQRLVSTEAEMLAFEKQPEATQWRELGRRLVHARRCVACHILPDGEKPQAVLPAQTLFAQLRDPERILGRGCLADAPGARGSAPGFAFSGMERAALRRFLVTGSSGAGSASPSYAARVALTRFNCLACHSRDGEGGLTTAMTDELRRMEKADNAEAITPPPLTGVAHKLRTSWIRNVLMQNGRARPYMALRMPQFGDRQVGKLPEGFASLEGIEPDDVVRAVAPTKDRVEAGRFLVGRGAFGCVTCHDIAGIVNSGTRGPDLASMNQRVRYDWYRRWLEEPQRMQPGTRMPSSFVDGKSLVKLLDGDGDRQADAIWAYLSLGADLPLPEGVQRPQAIVLAPAAKPIVLRTFMPEAGARALAVGYPGGVSMAFDTSACRLAYAWYGNFLDAAPVWNDRGGTPAKLLGVRFWQAPAGFPWALSEARTPPDFAARAGDPAYGAALPDGRYFGGPWHVHFRAYDLDGDGNPTFHYRLDGKGQTTLEVSERPGALSVKNGSGLLRQFNVTVPAGQVAWFRAVETGREPHVCDWRGKREPLDLTSGLVEAPHAGGFIMVPQTENEVLTLGASTVPDGSAWYLRKRGDRWEVLLRLPVANETKKYTIILESSLLPREDAGEHSELTKE